MKEITLTPDEIHFAAMHGIHRRMKKLEGARGDRIQKEMSSWDNEINGAGAELAFCKWRKCYWSGLSGLKAADGTAEVRWTRHYDTGGLIVYPQDDDSAYYTLADGGPRTFRFIGYLSGKQAKELATQTNFGMLVERQHLTLIKGS